jgi:ubiquinone/menaquinone biosynthesis C-methylase UbiE
MSKLADILLFRNHYLCPRWLCFTFDNGLRSLVQNPEKIVGSYLREGNVVLDVGPGIGYFTIPMAKKVGSGGKVIAADIQESMLRGIEKRAVHAGVRDRIELYLSSPDTVYAGEKVDFILAFWMVHEVPDSRGFLGRLYDALKDGGRFLLVEPKWHVSEKKFHSLLDEAGQAGFTRAGCPPVSLSYSALLTR